MPDLGEPEPPLAAEPEEPEPEEPEEEIEEPVDPSVIPAESDEPQAIGDLSAEVGEPQPIISPNSINLFYLHSEPPLQLLLHSFTSPV